MPTIQELVAQFQAQLDAQQAEAAQRLLSAYQMSYGTLSREQELLLLDIEARKARGETLSAAQIRRMERFQALMRQTEAEMDRYSRLIGETVERDAPGAAYLGTQFAERAFAEQLALLPPGTQAQIMTLWNQMPSGAVEALVGALQDESPLQRLTLAPFGRETAQGIGDALVRNLLMGRNPRVTAREMANAWGVPLTRALLISRTEQLRAYRAATRASYQRNAEVVKGWIWHAALDTRTCLSCLAQHGSVHGLDEMLDDHPNGRCAMAPITASWRELGFDIDDLPPVASPGDGEKWFRGQPENVQRAMMGPGRFDAWQAGKFEFRQLSKAVTDRDWGRTLVETPLKELI